MTILRWGKPKRWLQQKSWKSKGPTQCKASKSYWQKRRIFSDPEFTLVHLVVNHPFLKEYAQVKSGIISPKIFEITTNVVFLMIYDIV